MKSKIKNKIIAIRVDDDQVAQISAAALASGNMDIGDYVRRCAMLGIAFKLEAKIPEDVKLMVESMTFENPEGGQELSNKLRKHGPG